ncbi:NfeD family protein [Halosimplex pelagicum]|uniref:NfeD family protein n=1 Tax=Halosimplex pelagicum TaxID=869886 RepID=A0A7D5PB29_9EURY|nr:NfeD family protein [Halosimplex pelagicum]QLH81942.1 NfeD family protein [Halosimplex pelagicum]
MIEWIGQTSVLSWIGANLPLFLLLAGAALTIAEAFAPGAHFMVLGVALLVAGLVGLLLPPGLGVLAPLILAGLVVAAGAGTFYVYRQFDFYGGKGGPQTSDSDSLRGEIGRVTERITETEGEVKLDEGGFNPYYRAKSVDGEIEEGTEVMVVDPGGGNVVTVEPLTGGTDEIDRELARERQRSSSPSPDGDGEDRDDTQADRDDDEREFETDPA